jgi:hypothetical protein
MKHKEILKPGNKSFVENSKPSGFKKTLRVLNKIMNYQKRFLLWKLGIVVSLIGLVLTGCPDQQTNPTEPNGNQNLPADPGTGNLAGKIIGTINGQPMAGLTVTAQGKTANTGTDGTFRLNSVGAGTFAVTVSGSTIYTRTAAINTADGRSVLIDAIEKNSAFNLAFYREIARGNHPDEGPIRQTHCWTNTTPPTVYIDTDGSATRDGVIDANQINTVRQVIKQIIPVFTGNFYTSARDIKNKPFSRLDFDLDIPDNSIVISFDDSLILLRAFGLTQTQPDFTSSITSTMNKAIVRVVDQTSFYTSGGIGLDEVTAHEMGHAFGFRHTSTILPSVMIAAGAYGGLFSEADRLHMAIVYKRPAGNRDIDNDPIPGAKMVGEPLGKEIFIDQRANFPLSPEEISALRALPSKIPADLRQEIQNSIGN